MGVGVIRSKRNQRTREEEERVVTEYEGQGERCRSGKSDI